MDSQNTYYKGKILIANPFLIGSIFERSVIFLADHSETGSMGFILNQPTEFNVSQVVPQLVNCDFPVYYGGPVDEMILFYVNSLGDQIENSIPIANNLFWGGEFEQVKNLLLSGLLTQKNIKFFVGYSGWEINQLESEFEKNSWLINDFNPNYLFKSQTKNLWNKTIEVPNNEFSFFGKFAHSPSLN